jgi:hypothetical protein
VTLRAPALRPTCRQVDRGHRCGQVGNRKRPCRKPAHATSAAPIWLPAVMVRAQRMRFVADPAYPKGTPRPRAAPPPPTACREEAAANTPPEGMASEGGGEGVPAELTAHSSQLTARPASGFMAVGCWLSAPKVRGQLDSLRQTRVRDRFSGNQPIRHHPGPHPEFGSSSSSTGGRRTLAGRGRWERDQSRPRPPCRWVGGRRPIDRDELR